MRKEYWLYGAAVIAGAGVWIAVSAISGRNEAWDSSLYFSVGMPLLCVVAGASAIFEPNRYWRWAAVPMAAQVVWLLMSQGFGNMMPLGLIFFAVLSLPLLLFAKLGAFIGKKRAAETTP